MSLIYPTAWHDWSADAPCRLVPWGLRLETPASWTTPFERSTPTRGAPHAHRVVRHVVPAILMRRHALRLPPAGMNQRRYPAAWPRFDHAHHIAHAVGCHSMRSHLLCRRHRGEAVNPLPHLLPAPGIVESSTGVLFDRSALRVNQSHVPSLPSAALSRGGQLRLLSTRRKSSAQIACWNPGGRLWGQILILRVWVAILVAWLVR